MKSLTYFLVVTAVVNSVYGVEQDQTITLAAGASHDLGCTIDDVTITDVIQGNAVASWTKFQAMDSDGLDLNNGAAHANNLAATLEEHTDFEYIYQGQEVPVKLLLKLINVRKAESGRYVCKIRKSGNLVAEVVYTVRILDQILEVILYSMLDASDVGQSPNTTSWTHQPSISLGTKDSGYLACVVRGGYPAPVLQVTVGDRTITGHMPINDLSYNLVGDTLFEQMFETTRLLATNDFPVNIDEDGATITCTATIDNKSNQPFHTLSASSTLTLNAAPVFKNCSSTTMTPLGTKDFELRCEFIAKPGVTKLEWKAETTGDIIKRTDGSNGDYTASMQALDGEYRFEGILKIGTVEGSNFQQYTLIVGNAEGESDISITLLEGEEAPTQTANHHLSSILTFLIAMVMVAILL